MEYVLESPGKTDFWSQGKPWNLVFESPGKKSIFMSVRILVAAVLRIRPHSPSDETTCTWSEIGRVHLTVCSLTPPSVHPSTKDRHYQHAIYLVLYSKHRKTVLTW